jgi:hypothetical protein
VRDGGRERTREGEGRREGEYESFIRSERERETAMKYLSITWGRSNFP